jgi:hypothetical protein
MGDLSDFQGGQIVGVHLAGASVTKLATLLGVSKQQFPRLLQYTQIMERHHQLRGIVTENQN